MNETPESRSRIMRAVKGRDTSLEMTIRRLIYSMGYRYRLHRKDLPGKPDLVFSSRRKVLFIHGCFWHGHDCKRAHASRKPTANIGKRKSGEIKPATLKMKPPCRPLAGMFS